MNNQTEPNNAAELQFVARLQADIDALQFKQPTVIFGKNCVPMVIRNGEAHPVPDDWLTTPPFRKGPGFVFIDVDSFAEYVNSQKASCSRIYGSLSSARFVAVIDDHPTGAEGDPGARRHVVELKLTESADFKAWLDLSSGSMTQTEFADALERMAHTIIEPDSADIVDAIENLHLTADWKFSSSVNRTSGAVNMQFTNDLIDQSTSKVKVPSRIFIMAAPYLSMLPQKMEVRAAYRVKGPSVTFTVELMNGQQILLDAFTDVAKQITDKTEIKPYICQ